VPLGTDFGLIPRFRVMRPKYPPVCVLKSGIIAKYFSRNGNIQMPDLNSLALFAAVIDAKSFSRAAQQLKMPTSTVSRRIAELEKELGARLLERSTRNLRLTDFGADVLQYAHQSADIVQEVANIATDHVSGTSGTLRLAAPPSISDSLLAPLICDFQSEFPQISVQIFITERVLDLITDGVDLKFWVSHTLEDSSVVARRILTYRHQLVASPEYLGRFGSPKTPDELRNHRLLAFSFWKPKNTWKLFHTNGKDQHKLQFQPHLSINEYVGLATALVRGTGIGELPPIVQPELLRSGKLVEIMPRWRFRSFHLSILHLSNRYIAKPVRLFKEFATDRIPSLFPKLPA
jgi:DNA-binding transcriptional LysR family regulator